MMARKGQSGIELIFALGVAVFFLSLVFVLENDKRQEVREAEIVLEMIKDCQSLALMINEVGTGPDSTFTELEIGNDILVASSAGLLLLSDDELHCTIPFRHISNGTHADFWIMQGKISLQKKDGMVLIYEG